MVVKDTTCLVSIIKQLLIIYCRVDSNLLLLYNKVKCHRIMSQDKSIIKLDAGEEVEAFAPIIVSASRATDIPAFYADWFFNRLKKGYSAWINPFNGVKSFVSYENTRLIVFWSKNPKPLLKHLPKLKQKNIGTYIQYSLNDYDHEKIEENVPNLSYRIDTFKRLVDELGYGKVIWRFDPLILTDNINEDLLLDKLSKIGDQLKGYTEKLVFSYADIGVYRKVKTNLDKNGVNYREFDEKSMHYIAKNIQELNRNWGYQLGTCCEHIDLSMYDVEHNKCIDDELIYKYFQHDDVLMKYIGAKIVEKTLFKDRYVEFTARPDKGQRNGCHCIKSKDIGQYNTCPHACIYCYANTNKEKAISNYKMARNDKHGELIIPTRTNAK